MPEDGVIENAEKIIDAGVKIVDALTTPDNQRSLQSGKPSSISARKPIDDCQKKLMVAEDFAAAEKCSIRKGRKTWSRLPVEFHRIGIKTDECFITINLSWSYDGCGIYDILLTEQHEPVNSDWIITLTGTVTLLEVKEKGECVCCNEGGDCVFISIECEVERDIFFWPNAVLHIKKSGTLCAANGIFNEQ